MNEQSTLSTFETGGVNHGSTNGILAFSLGIFLACCTAAYPTTIEAKPISNFKQLYSKKCRGPIDWHAVGFHAGTVGIEEGYFSDFQRFCARFGKVPDKATYFEAYKLGISQYCSPGNIYQLARQGAVAVSACEDKPAIRQAIRDGFSNLIKK